MKTIFYIYVLSIFTLLGCGKKRVDIKEGVYFPKNEKINNLNFQTSQSSSINLPLLIISNDSLFSVNLENKANQLIDTFKVNNKFIDNKKEKLKYKYINDSIIEIEGKNQFFNDKKIQYVRMNLKRKKSFNFSLSFFTKNYLFSNNLSNVKEINKDSIFLFFDTKKSFNSNKLFYYTGSDSRNQASIGSWDYLNVGGYNIIKFNFVSNAYLILENVDKFKIEGVIYYK